MEGFQLISCIPGKQPGNNPGEMFTHSVTALQFYCKGHKTNHMKQEIMRTRILIIAACAFTAIIIVGMFAAAGYL